MAPRSQLVRSINILRDDGSLFKLRTYNAISPVGLDRFPRGQYEVSSDATNAKAIMLRSHKLQDDEVEETVRGIARCGAGVNNIPVDRMTERGIVVFNTPGSNANAVKELAICGMLLCSRGIAQGAQWSLTHEQTDEDAFAKDVETAKKQFGGMELKGKTLGVIGLGNIGAAVAEAACSLGMKALCYDPHLTLEAAFSLDPHRMTRVESLEGVLKDSDFVTLHVPYIPGATHHLINEERLSLMKPTAHILNFSRGGLVDEDALKARLDGAASGMYCTDFPSLKLRAHDQVISLPHLGASTEEAEEQSAAMAAEQLISFLETGSIVNSVNFPMLQVAPLKPNRQRLCLANVNEEGVLSKITSALSDLNIAKMFNKSKGSVAYTIVDVEGEVPDAAIEQIESDLNILTVRVIRNS